MVDQGSGNRMVIGDGVPFDAERERVSTWAERVRESAERGELAGEVARATAVVRGRAKIWHAWNGESADDVVQAAVEVLLGDGSAGDPAGPLWVRLVQVGRRRQSRSRAHAKRMESLHALLAAEADDDADADAALVVDARLPERVDARAALRRVRAEAEAVAPPAVAAAIIAAESDHAAARASAVSRHRVAVVRRRLTVAASGGAYEPR